MSTSEETPSEDVILNWLETSGFEVKQFFRILAGSNTVGKIRWEAFVSKKQPSFLASDGMLMKRPILVENGAVKQMAIENPMRT